MSEYSVEDVRAAVWELDQIRDAALASESPLVRMVRDNVIDSLAGAYDAVLAGRDLYDASRDPLEEQGYGEE